MSRYIVEQAEVFIGKCSVEADSPEEAIAKVFDGNYSHLSTEYSHTDENSGNHPETMGLDRKKCHELGLTGGGDLIDSIVDVYEE